MQINLENISALEKRLTVALPLAPIETEIESRLKNIARTARIHGFRPGKVPLKVVAQQYGGQVRQEVLGDTVQQSFAEAVRQQKLRVAGYPRIETRSAPQDALSFEFSATFEIYPEVVPGDISAASIERPDVKVTVQDVDKTIEILRKQRVTYQAVERAAQQGDQVEMDYRGTLDGKEFEGGQAKGHTLVLGEGQTLPDFEGQIVGMQPGANKTFEVSFPADYQGKELAGKVAVFDVTLLRAAEPKLPEVDAEFSRSLGVADGDLGKMRAEVQANLEREIKKRLQSRLKEQVMQALLDATPLELPVALVEMEIERLKESTRQDMVARGMTRIDMPMPSDLFEKQARRRVGLGLILSEVVRINQLLARTEQVRAMVEDLAQSYEHPDQVVRWYYEDAKRLAEMEAIALEDNVVAWVMQHAKVVDKTATFDELMGIAK